jgi:hypothetical protein
MRYLFILIILAQLDCWGQSQTFSKKVQPLFDYELSLRTYYRKLRDSQREEFEDLNKKSIATYLPDVGLQFGLPSINFKFSDYLKYNRDLKIFERKLLSIDEKMALELNTAIQELRIEYKKLSLEHDRLTTARDRMVFVENLFKISQECCQKRACTPEDCRKRELDHFEQKQRLREAEINFDILILEFEKLARYGLPEFRF